MPVFSTKSKEALNTCDPRLQVVFNAVIKHIDLAIIEGHRGKEAQDKAFADGFSKLKWPHGKHNSMPSKAVDIAPWPIDWNDPQRFRYFAGFVMATAVALGVPLRWGGDWDGDTELKDEKFSDLGHFEIDEP